MKQLIKFIILKLKNIGKNVKFHISNIAVSSEFEGNNRIGKSTFFAGKIGFGSYLGENCHIVADIGRYCCIANNVVTAIGKHPTSQWISIHPAFFSTKKQGGFTFVSENKFCETNGKISIGNDVWIGTNVTILDGVSIGDGAVVAAGSVVTKNVEPYTIVAGVPAKVIDKRFDDNEIGILKKLKWWDKDLNWIKENANKFDNIKNFENE